MSSVSDWQWSGVQGEPCVGMGPHLHQWHCSLEHLDLHHTQKTALSVEISVHVLYTMGDLSPVHHLDYREGAHLLESSIGRFENHLTLTPHTTVGQDHTMHSVIIGLSNKQ